MSNQLFEVRVVIENGSARLAPAITHFAEHDHGFLTNLKNHSVVNYRELVDRLLQEKPEAIAMANAIGANDLEGYRISGDGHVAVLRHHGLTDGMRIYDLGCGSGRTASALQRSGWNGEYMGHDIVDKLVQYLNGKCPGYHAQVHLDTTICAADDSLDIVFHWSVFTHLFHEECFNYLIDIHRALKPGGKLIFSFLELEDPRHVDQVFLQRAHKFRVGERLDVLDTFLHRGQIETMARLIGFADVSFTDGDDDRHHPSFWQSLVTMVKPAK